MISYNDVGGATSDNFIEHGINVIVVFQSCRIGSGSCEDEMILNDWLGIIQHTESRQVSRCSHKLSPLRHPSLKFVFRHNSHNNTNLSYNFYDAFSPLLLYIVVLVHLVQPYMRTGLYFIIHFRTNPFMEFKIITIYRDFTLGAIYSSSFQIPRITFKKGGRDLISILSSSLTYLIIPIFDSGSFLIRLPR